VRLVEAVISASLPKFGLNLALLLKLNALMASFRKSALISVKIEYGY
jgi:hypothetical protein